MCLSRQPSTCGFARSDELSVVPLDELVEQRRLGPVTSVARRIDEGGARQRARSLAMASRPCDEWQCLRYATAEVRGATITRQASARTDRHSRNGLFHDDDRAKGPRAIVRFQRTTLFNAQVTHV